MMAVRKGSVVMVAIVVVVALGWAACGDSEPSHPVMDPPLEGGKDVVMERDDYRVDSSYPDVDSGALDADAKAEAAAKNWPDARPEGSEDYDWLFDPDAWIPVPEITETNVAVADVSKLQWPGFVWEDCGVGCRMSTFDPGPLEVLANYQASSVRLIAGQWIGSFSLAYPFPNGNGNRIVLRVNLDSNEVWDAIRVLKTVPGALLSFVSNDVSRIFTITQSNQPRIVGGLAAQLGTPLQWLSPRWEVGPYRAAFDFDTTWHWGAVVDHHAVKVATQPGSTDLELVHSGTYIQEMAVAGSSLYWVECEDPTARLWGWTLGGQVEVLASGPWHASMVAASKDRLAWVAAQGPDYCYGGYESADLYWSARTDNAQALDVQGPVAVPITRKAPLAVSTEWAAMSYSTESNTVNKVLVVRLSDGKKWEIPPRSQGFLNRVLSVREHEVLTLEVGSITINMPWLVRYDLTKLDQYATDLP